MAQCSPSRVKSGPGAARYASWWDVAPGGPDRARSCHWPPLTPSRMRHIVRCVAWTCIRIIPQRKQHFRYPSSALTIFR